MKSAPLGPDDLLSHVSTLGSPTSPSFDPWCFPGADCFASMTRGPPGPEAQSTFKLGSEALDIIQPEAPKFLLLIEFFLPETLRPKIEKATALLEDVRGNLPLLRGLWKPGLKSLLWHAPNQAGNPAGSVYHQNHLTSPQGGAQNQPKHSTPFQSSSPQITFSLPESSQPWSPEVPHYPPPRVPASFCSCG